MSLQMIFSFSIYVIYLLFLLYVYLGLPVEYQIKLVGVDNEPCLDLDISHRWVFCLFFKLSLIELKKILCISNFLRVFISKRHGILLNTFICMSWNDHRVFFPLYFVIMVNYIDSFLNAERALYFQDTSNWMLICIFGSTLIIFKNICIMFIGSIGLQLFACKALNLTQFWNQVK